MVKELVKLFNEVDTPELREICGEDEWIRKQRYIYWRVKKGLDCDITLESLLDMAVEDAVCHFGRSQVTPKAPQWGGRE